VPQGVVTPDLTPGVTLLPTSPQIAVAWWALTAQLASDLAHHHHAQGGGEPPPRRRGGQPAAAAHEYVSTLMQRLSSLHHSHLASMHQAGEAIAEKVLAGGKLYPWSGRDEFYIEASNTACGIRGNYPLAQHFAPLDPGVLTSADVLLLATGNATPEAEVEMARAARARGAYIVGIYPFVRADSFSMDELRGLCDISIDNQSGDAGGILTLPGYSHSVIPTQGCMNNYAYCKERAGVSYAPHICLSI
jgi:hypothetical protein